MNKLNDTMVQQKYIELMTEIHKYIFDTIKNMKDCEHCQVTHDLTVDIDIKQQECDKGNLLCHSEK